MKEILSEWLEFSEDIVASDYAGNEQLESLRYKTQEAIKAIPIEPPVKVMATGIRENLYQQLRSQISIYAGKRDGGLATLQDLYNNLNEDKPIICECCKQEIDGKGGHLTGCEIVKEYFKLFRGESSHSA